MQKVNIIIKLILCLLFSTTNSFAVKSSLPHLPDELKQMVDAQIANLPKKELSISAIEKLLSYDKDMDNLVRLVNIHDGQVHMMGFNGNVSLNRYGTAVSHALKRLAKDGHIKDGTFVFYFNDGASKDLHRTYLHRIPKNLPVFVFALDVTLADANRYLLFPDGYTLNEGGTIEVEYWNGWRYIYNEINKASAEYPWESKMNVGLWRGRLTECFFAPNCTFSPRRNLVLDYEHDKRIDAKFATARVTDISKREQPYKHLYTGDFISRKDQLKYKYLFNLDGSTCTYPGYLWRLYSNSVVLKQETNNIQWFYPLFKPYKHYIPINLDMSNVAEQLDWLEAHDSEARQIAENATAQVEKYVTPDMIDAYIVYLLNKFSSEIEIVK